MTATQAVVAFIDKHPVRSLRWRVVVTEEARAYGAGYTFALQQPVAAESGVEVVGADDVGKILRLSLG